LTTRGAVLCPKLASNGLQPSKTKEKFTAEAQRRGEEKARDSAAHPHRANGDAAPLSQRAVCPILGNIHHTLFDFHYFSAFCQDRHYTYMTAVAKGD
jgi:hypothetical protein